LVSFRFVLVSVLLFSALTVPCASGTFGNEATPIRHIIVIVQENHSFDNYFGTYPSANGSLVNAITARLHPVDGLPGNICVRNGTTCYSPYLSSVSNPINPVEGQITYEQDYAASKMSRFVKFSGLQSMAYFDYHQIAAYWDYAEEYGLADRYFASALSTTTPNRLLLLAGDSPVANNYGPPPYLDYNQTILGELDAHGLSWGYFDFVNKFGLTRDVYPLNYLINGTVEGHVEDVSRLFAYLKAGTGLPAVSFVNALGHSFRHSQ
jgi:phospholipase C